MVAIAIVSADPVVRRNLAEALHGHPSITAMSVIDDAAAVPPLIEQEPPDVILADSPSAGDLTVWRSKDGELTIIALVDDPSEAQVCRDALQAGASAILPRSVDTEEVMAAVNAVMEGLAVLPQELLPTLLDGASLGEDSITRDEGHARLTPRELEVLTAMADGASNKTIARHLGISIHTVKFHVAGILAKLRADSRTEAVMRAAQLGLVML
jgi:NarL family two-component system response regulator YdfI